MNLKMISEMTQEQQEERVRSIQAIYYMLAEMTNAQIRRAEQEVKNIKERNI